MPPVAAAAAVEFPLAEAVLAGIVAGASSIIETPARGSCFVALTSTTTGSSFFADVVDLVEDADLVVVEDFAVEALFAVDLVAVVLLLLVVDPIDLLIDVAVLFTDDFTELSSLETLAVVPAISDFSPASSLSTLDFRSLTLTPVCFSNSPVISVVMRRKSRISFPACPAISGNLSGPNIMTAITAMTRISCHPIPRKPMNAIPHCYQPNLTGQPLGLWGLASVEYSTGIIATLRSKLRKEASEFDEELETRQVKIIVGLGNPGKKYEDTRHNLGFMVIDELRKRLTPETNRERFKSQIWEARLGGERIVLAKPQTYMNLSGDAVSQIQHWYKSDPDHMLVVYDDLDLEFGQLRMRESGSAGGHNGLTSVIQMLGTTEVPRLRIGIGRGRSAAKAHVLSNFSPAEREALPGVIERATEGALLWLSQGPIPAMNAINAKPVPANSPDRSKEADREEPAS